MVVLERDQFPRFHIGESLLASVNDALAAIGAGDVVRRAGFPQKWGATFLTGDGATDNVDLNAKVYVSVVGVAMLVSFLKAVAP